MRVADRMAARLATEPESEQGTPCRWCKTTALACAYRHVTLDEWCCAACRANGARIAHKHDPACDG
jgi:hypothetical protein